MKRNIFFHEKKSLGSVFVGVNQLIEGNKKDGLSTKSQLVSKAPHAV